MQQRVFWFLLCTFIIHTQSWTMDEHSLKLPELFDTQKSWLVIRIPYPAFDSNWRDGKPDSGEWSPELLKSKIMEALSTLVKGRITAKYETLGSGRPRSHSTASATQMDAPATFERGTSAIALHHFSNVETQTESIVAIEPEDNVASAAEASPATRSRRQFEPSEIDEPKLEPVITSQATKTINPEDSSIIYTIGTNRYIIASASFLGGVLAALSLKRK